MKCYLAQIMICVCVALLLILLVFSRKYILFMSQESSSSYLMNLFLFCAFSFLFKIITQHGKMEIYIYIYRTGIFDCRINLTSSGHLHFLSSFCDKIIIVDIIDSSSSLAFLLYIVLGFRFTNRHSL